MDDMLDVRFRAVEMRVKNLERLATEGKEEISKLHEVVRVLKDIVEQSKTE